MESSHVWALRALGVLSLAFLLAAWIDYRRYDREREALVALLVEAGFESRQPAVIDRVIHERTPHHAQLLTARALIYDILDAAPATAPRERSLIVGTPEWIEGVNRLRLAAELSRSALEAHAGSFEAAMFLGISVYLERSLNRDPRLVTVAADWEAPLSAAVAAAPGKSEPRRLLAGAYLELWRSLSPAKRELTRELLTEAFAEDLAAFRTLAPVWLEVAEDLDQAFSVIPERVSAWSEVERIYAESQRWEAFRRAHDQRLQALLAESERQLAESIERLRLGDLFNGRSLLLQVVARAPLETRFAPLVTGALSIYPPGLHGLDSTASLRDWLRFSFELDRLGQSPFPPRVIGRLASAAGELPPTEEAHAALLSGDLAYAERLERLGETLSSPSWGAYLAAKANWLLERGRIDEASLALGRAGRAAREDVDHALAAVRLARSRGDGLGLAAAERRLAEHRRVLWSAAEWRFQGRRATLSLLPSRPARGVVMTVNRVPRGGAVVGFYWDGRLVALEALESDSEVTLELGVEERLHLLELRMVRGGQVLPGKVELLAGREPRRP